MQRLPPAHHQYPVGHLEAGAGTGVGAGATTAGGGGGGAACTTGADVGAATVGGGGGGGSACTTGAVGGGAGAARVTPGDGQARCEREATKHGGHRDAEAWV